MKTYCFHVGQKLKITKPTKLYFGKWMYYKYITFYNFSFQNQASKLKLLMNYLKSYDEHKDPYSFQIPLKRQQLMYSRAFVRRQSSGSLKI